MNTNGTVPFPTPGLGRTIHDICHKAEDGTAWEATVGRDFLFKWRAMTQEEKSRYFEDCKKNKKKDCPNWRRSECAPTTSPHYPPGYRGPRPYRDMWADHRGYQVLSTTLTAQPSGPISHPEEESVRTPPRPRPRPPTATPATRSELERCKKRLATMKKQLGEHKAIREAGGKSGYHWTEFTSDNLIKRQEERIEDLEKKCKELEGRVPTYRPGGPKVHWGQSLYAYPTTDEGFTFEDIKEISPERFPPTPTPGHPPGMRPVPFAAEEGVMTPRGPRPKPHPGMEWVEGVGWEAIGPGWTAEEAELLKRGTIKPARDNDPLPFYPAVPTMEPPVAPKPKPAPTRPTGMRPAIPTPPTYTGPQLQPGGAMPGGVMSPLTGAQFTLGGGFHPRLAQGPFQIPPSFGVSPEVILEPLRAEIRGLYGRLPPEEQPNVAEDLAACNLMAAQGEYEDALACLKVVHAEASKIVSEYEKIPLGPKREDPEAAVSPWVYGAVGVGVLAAIFALR